MSDGRPPDDPAGRPRSPDADASDETESTDADAAHASPLSEPADDGATRKTESPDEADEDGGTPSGGGASGGGASGGGTNGGGANGGGANGGGANGGGDQGDADKDEGANDLGGAAYDDHTFVAAFAWRLSPVLLIALTVLAGVSGYQLLVGRSFEPTDAGVLSPIVWLSDSIYRVFFNGVATPGEGIRQFPLQSNLEDNGAVMANRAFDLLIVQFVFVSVFIVFCIIRACLIRFTDATSRFGVFARNLRPWPADVHYYLGFIFTLLSLAFGLAGRNVTGGGNGTPPAEPLALTDHVQSIISNAAAAMISTVIGVTLYFAIQLFEGVRPESLGRGDGRDPPPGSGGAGGSGGSGGPGGPDDQRPRPPGFFRRFGLWVGRLWDRLRRWGRDFLSGFREGAMAHVPRPPDGDQAASEDGQGRSSVFDPPAAPWGIRNYRAPPAPSGAPSGIGSDPEDATRAVLKPKRR